MSIGIIGAMQVEVNHLIEKMDKLETIKIHHLVFYKGYLNNKSVVLVSSGIGKVSSGLIIGIMNSHFSISHIINIGVSGGVLGNVSIGEVVCGSSYSYADVIVPEVEFGQIPNLPKLYHADKKLLEIASKSAKSGLILTGDKFFLDEKEVSFITKNHFENEFVVCFDMESTAFAQACYLLNIPFIALRAISDCIGMTDQEKVYYISLEKACINANLILLSIIDKL